MILVAIAFWIIDELPNLIIEYYCMVLSLVHFELVTMFLIGCLVIVVIPNIGNQLMSVTIF